MFEYFTLSPLYSRNIPFFAQSVPIGPSGGPCHLTAAADRRIPMRIRLRDRLPGTARRSIRQGRCSRASADSPGRPSIPLWHCLNSTHSVLHVDPTAEQSQVSRKLLADPAVSQAASVPSRHWRSVLGLQDDQPNPGVRMPRRNVQVHVPEDTASGLVEHEIPKPPFARNRLLLFQKSVAGRWRDNFENDVTDLAFGAGGNYAYRSRAPHSTFGYPLTSMTGLPSTLNFGSIPRPGLLDALIFPSTLCGALSAMETLQ